MPEESLEFSVNAQLALVYAKRQAEKLNSLFICSTHMLVGIIEVGEGTAYECFRSLEVNRVRLMRQLVTIHPEEGAPKAHQSGLYSVEAKQALFRGSQESRRAHDSLIRTIHLLLGILDTDTAQAKPLLHQEGLSVEKVRRYLSTLYDEEGD